MFVLIRALTYSSFFIAFLLVFVPAQVLARYGVAAPETLETRQLAGIALAIAGGLVAAACILTFVVLGRGTPAPFDPPRRLVIRGPYRVIRNPMYVGAAIALAGAAVYYGSLALFAYAAVFLAVMHLLVVLYEEPTLRRTFGADYEAYCGSVGRWWPRV